MTDRNDGHEQPSSSEDLIRQAREAYEPAEANASAAAGRGSAVDRGAMSNPILDADPMLDHAASSSMASPSEFGADVASEPVVRPSDYVRDEYRDQPLPPTDGTATYQAHQPSFLARYGRFLIFGAIIAGVLVYNMLDKTKDVEDLAVGECLLMPSADEITSIETASCDSAHELEVFALVSVPDSKTAPYPGQSQLGDSMYEQCLPHFESYIGASFDTSVWWINAIYPTRESWEEADDRAGTCVVFQLGPDDEPITLTGSARGSGE